jgi:hypothetical protein
MKCSTLHKGRRFTVDYCALFVGGGVKRQRRPFDNMYDWKGIWEKAAEDGRVKAYITNDEASR